MAATAVLGPAAGAGGGFYQGAIQFLHPPEDPLGLVKSPLSFFVAAGPANACGEGCSTWISAEGEFDSGAAQRFEAFLERVDGYKLPVFFSSPGGYGSSARAIGRLMRKKGMTAGVGKTLREDHAPEAGDGCTNSNPDPNRIDERSAGRSTDSCEVSPGRVVAAQLHGIAVCSSACVDALIGATVRLVPPGARLGVHSSPRLRWFPSGRVDYVPRDASTGLIPSDAEAITRMRSYVLDMGIDPGLVDLIATVPYEKIHWLSRDEIARFGIDTREFAETPWMELSQSPPSLIKAVQLVEGPQPRGRRLSMVRLTCAKPGVVHVTYYRGLGSTANGTPPGFSFESEGRNVVLTKPSTRTQISGLETHASFDVYDVDTSIGFFEAVGNRATIDLVESEFPDGHPDRRTSLSTVGFAQGMRKMLHWCGDAAQ